MPSTNREFYNPVNDVERFFNRMLDSRTPLSDKIAVKQAYDKMEEINEHKNLFLSAINKETGLLTDGHIEVTLLEDYSAILHFFPSNRQFRPDYYFYAFFNEGSFFYCPHQSYCFNDAILVGLCWRAGCLEAYHWVTKLIDMPPTPSAFAHIGTEKGA